MLLRGVRQSSQERRDPGCLPQRHKLHGAMPHDGYPDGIAQTDGGAFPSRHNAARGLRLDQHRFPQRNRDSQRDEDA